MLQGGERKRPSALDWKGKCLLCLLGMTIVQLVMLNNYINVLSSNYRCVMKPSDDISLLYPEVVKKLKGQVLEKALEAVEGALLAHKVRLLCWVPTTPAHFYYEATAVKNTWGKRCHKLVFMSSQAEQWLEAVDLHVNDTHLWNKTKAALRYLYDHYLNEYDWFFKADTDTYVVVENLRYMLANQNHSRPLYFGQYLYNFKFSRGAGYVLSRESLKRLVEISLKTHNCPQHAQFGEESILRMCLAQSGVQFGEIRDHLGRDRFFHYDIFRKFARNKDKVFYQNIEKASEEWFSDAVISFNLMTVPYMHLMEHILYNAHPFGTLHTLPFPAPVPSDTEGPVGS